MQKIFRQVFILVIVLGLSPFLAKAQDFDYNNIISDEQLANHTSMSQMDTKNFLQQKNSYLASYWYSGNNPAPTEWQADSTKEYIKERSATEIIYNAAQEAKINPQFLLTMLQKEMSLIEDQNPTERQLAFAMGYYCFDGQSCNPRWRGFGKQIRATALQFRDYLDNIQTRTYNPYTTSMIEGQAIRPANAATAGLYNYTPHLHGNELFATIWQRYNFSTAVSNITGVIPEGSLVKAKDGEDTATIYLIHNNQKQPFVSMTALVSRFDPKRVLTVSAEELNKFSLGAPIKYAAYSILQGPDGSRYLLDGLQKRLISSNEVFKNLGFNPEEIEEATAEDLNNIPDGSVISDVAQKPLAQLLRAPSGGVFYVKDNTKSAIVDPAIIEINFPDLKITKTTDEVLNQFKQIEPIKIFDGILLKSSDSAEIYVIANGERRWITDENTFRNLGYSWSNIITVDPRIMKLHKIGQPLSL